LLVFTATAGYWVWKRHIALQVPTWFASEIDGRTQFTPAGYWYAFGSLTIFRFLFFRWYFRVFIWYRFLWQIARKFSLRLNPLHPDRAGGLGFLADSVFALAPVLLAHTVLAAGLVGGRIWHQGASLPEFKLELFGLMAFLMLVALVPLIFFIPNLASAKRAGLRQFGAVAARYASEFQKKWFEGGAGASESLLGSADIQSLADLSGSFDVVRETRLLPFGKQTVLQLALVIALPLAPLALTMVPFEEMLDRILGLLL
jgi:hypothetical protein